MLQYMEGSELEPARLSGVVPGPDSGKRLLEKVGAGVRSITEYGIFMAAYQTWCLRSPNDWSHFGRLITVPRPFGSRRPDHVPRRTLILKPNIKQSLAECEGYSVNT